MSIPLRLASRAWIILAACAIGFTAWNATARERRIQQVSTFGTEGVLVSDAHSPTGYAGGVRRLVLANPDGAVYEWIAQTQEMLATSRWHVRRVDHDNAPVGREVSTPALDRWVLGALAKVVHAATGRPLGACVEEAALWASPALLGLLILGAGAFAARRFGGFAAALAVVALAAMFPLAAVGGAGVPCGRVLALACVWWSVAPVVAALSRPRPAGDSGAREGAGDFLCAGIAGGIGLWLDPAGQWPVLAAVAASAAIVARIARKIPAWPTGTLRAWRLWALGGALTTLAAFLLEGAPDRLAGFRLDTAHPLFGLAWLGAGEWIARLASPAPTGRWRNQAVLIASTLAILAVPIVAWSTGGNRLFSAGAEMSSLGPLAGAADAGTVREWLVRDGLDRRAWAMLAPLLIFIPAALVGWRAGRGGAAGTGLTIAFVAALVAAGFASIELRWWAGLDVLLIVLLAATVSPAREGSEGRRAIRRALAGGVIALAAGPALLLLLTPTRTAGAAEGFTVEETRALIERDIAYWLANRAGGEPTVVLAPPATTLSLWYHGGLRGLGTPDPGNREGFAAAARIAGSTAVDEAYALATRRTLTHIVVPSWDGFLDDYAKLGGNSVDKTLIGQLHHWLPPRWLRPVAYQLPQVAGFDNQSVTIFEVVGLQDNETSLCRLAEYFAEMGLRDEAAAAGEALARMFPEDPGTLLARAEVAMACEDGPTFTTAVTALVPRLKRKAGWGWAWDQRVRLAIVLAEAKKYDLARAEVKRCLEQVDERRLRTLGMIALFRFQTLCRGFDEPIADPALSALAHNLLPPEMRQGL